MVNFSLGGAPLDAPPLRLDYHDCADWQKPFELVNVLIVNRDAAGRPVDIADIQNRIVGAVDADLPAFTRPSRYFAIIAQLGEMLAVVCIGIIQLEKPFETAAPM